jgi:polysaccharide biosynthesis/export protein
MTRFKLIIFCITSSLFLNSCSEILEPVSIFVNKQNVTETAVQEEFEINIKSLTFKAAKEANSAPYPRSLILTGNGSGANVSDEANFLKSNFPKPSNNFKYLIGIGDVITFKQLNEFKIETVQWPSGSDEREYLLGAGDELTYLHSNESNQDASIASVTGQLISQKENDALIFTQGVIGSNGNILLYGLGNIQAANRTLDDVRTEVRNILIRNGSTSNFQLEISDFQSRKAYIVKSNGDGQTYQLNNLPTTLRELALVSGLSESNENFAVIKLTRNEQEFRFTAGQLFDLAAPEIIIRDNDQIEINIAPSETKIITTSVGPKGNILLEGVGSIFAMNRTLDDIHEEISNIFIGQGIKPNFQLEVTNFVSKKAYLIEDTSSKVLPLAASGITLRELIINNGNGTAPELGLTIVTLKRNGQVFRMTAKQVLDPKTQDIWIIDKDQIEVQNLAYKSGQVFALSGAGKAKVVPIDPSKRETLADILFVEDGVLNNLLAKRSEVYLLRGRRQSVAYHLDAQNVSRVLVAAKTELRPNDIVYVADRPIISFSRALGEILPLRALLRDIKNNNLP